MIIPCLGARGSGHLHIDEPTPSVRCPHAFPDAGTEARTHFNMKRGTGACEWVSVHDCISVWTGGRRSRAIIPMSLGVLKVVNSVTEYNYIVVVVFLRVYIRITLLDITMK